MLGQAATDRAELVQDPDGCAAISRSASSSRHQSASASSRPIACASAAAGESTQSAGESTQSAGEVTAGQSDASTQSAGYVTSVRRESPASYSPDRLLQAETCSVYHG